MLNCPVRRIGNIISCFSDLGAYVYPSPEEHFPLGYLIHSCGISALQQDFCLADYFSLINAIKHKDIHLSTLNQFNPKSTMCFRENNENGNTQTHKTYQLAVTHNSACFLMTVRIQDYGTAVTVLKQLSTREKKNKS